MRPLVSFAVALAASSSLAQTPASARQAFPTNEQLRHLRAFSHPRLSPDGKQALLQITDTTADGAKNHLWLIETSGPAAARQLTYSPDNDKRGEHDAEWMPDGRSILFLAKRGEHTSLYRLPMNGGEAKPFDLKITPIADESKLPRALPPKEASPEAKPEVKPDAKEDPIPLDVANFCIAPDGKSIALLASDPQTPGEKKQKDAKADAEWVDHSLHGDRLYLFDVASGKLTMAGVAIDVRGAAWSDDSSRLVVIREEPNGASELGPANSAVVVTVADPSHAAKLEQLPATLENAAWAPDGKTLFYLAQGKRDAPPGFPDLYQYDLATRSSKDLTDSAWPGKMPGSLGRLEPLPLKDGSVLAAVEQGVEVTLARYPTAGAPQSIKVPFAALREATTNTAQSGWLLLGDSGGKPTQLFYAASLSDTPRALEIPSTIPEGIQSIAPKRIQWKNEKLTLDGLLYLPPEANSKKVPLIVEVHGGPLGAYVDSYSVFTDFLLGQGWAVLRTNPRGSSGRGAEFAAANKNDLGGADYRDIMAGVDYVLKTEPALDPHKLALTGYSYGGEMAGFVETKTTRFKAIVSMAPVIDQNSEYGTERGSWYDQWYYGKPWEHQADAWRQSPLSGAEHAHTRFLLLQGEGDTTDPLGQAQEMYRALRQMKVPVELVTYPRDDHGPLGGAIYGSPSPEPWHGFDARRRIVEFIKSSF